jgi:osmotically inducible protein OsmC
MKRTAAAHWTGTGKEGTGTLSAPGGVLKETPYSFAQRFGDKPGTNPEELIAAAHAGCFSMALAFGLTGAGSPPASIDTKATVTLDSVPGGFAITAVHLDVTARVPGIDQAKFQSIATEAKTNCPVSKVLNAKITMEAKLAAS